MNQEQKISILTDTLNRVKECWDLKHTLSDEVVGLIDLAIKAGSM